MRSPGREVNAALFLDLQAPLRRYVGVLASSAMAIDMYRRLGFQEHTRIGMYVADFRVPSTGA
ncbi:MAG: hypothetical protein HY332_15000 [Chloroflexi bacterium]|nr:hypothetical protein [Chloroflexota bacterium]